MNVSDDQSDRWPIPKYNPGSHKHLHALGVIAVTYAQFQRGIDSLYFIHPRNQKFPDELIDLYYYGLSEEKRIEAVRKIFDLYEKSDGVKAAIKNLLDYFRWCKNTRDQILHAEQYPAAFGGDPDVLHLTKRISKQSPEAGYIALTLDELRSIADKMRAGVVQGATINIHLRVRDVPIEKIELSLRAYKDEELPAALGTPPLLELTPKP